MNNEIPPLVRKILSRQGMTDYQEMQRFIFPSLSNLPHPEDMLGIRPAVELICSAMSDEREIVIWGDYDVDGTTGTSLLITFFRELGVEPLWHIPNRLTDGYGLSSSGIRQLRKRIVSDEFVLITVDCGISNTFEIDEISKCGGKVIVTDHHQLPIDSLPDCIIINPNQEGCPFQSHKLAGVGVAFYLAAALRAELDRSGYFGESTKPNLKEYLGFVALGTVADLVELTSVNRTLVRGGMEALQASSIPGLMSLMDNAGLKRAELTSEDIAFSLGPRINAAGRLGAAEVAVNLMTCDNEVAGAQLSRVLTDYNNKRKDICADNLESALESIQRHGLHQEPAIVVSGEFHSGVIGIVASKIVDIYGKPTIVFSRECKPDGQIEYKGSGRSIDGVDLLQCLHGCAAHMLKYGGHSMAAGLSVHDSGMIPFVSAFYAEVSIALLNRQHGTQEGVLVIESCIDEIMREENLKYLMKLEPFGPLNERPIFLDKNASIVHCRKIGSNKEHLQLTFRGRFANYSGVGFGHGDRFNEVRQNPTRPVSFYPSVNRYNGSVEWQLRVVDL